MKISSTNGDINANPHKFAHVRNQFLAVSFVNIMALSHGMLLGWLSSATLILSGDDSPMVGGPVDITLISWIGGISNVGSLIGNFFFTWLTGRFGRRVAFSVLGLPNIIYWIGIIFIRQPEYLLLFRLIGGLSGGGVFICIPLFVADIASDHVRGTLGALLVTSLNFGFLISYITGAYLPYHIVPCVHVAFPVIFLVGSFFLHDSPQYLLERGQEKEAEKSLRFYKGCRSATGKSQIRFEEELSRLQNYVKSKTVGDVKYSLKDFTNPEARRGLLIGILIMSINIFSGGLLMLNYAGKIFKDSGSDLDTNISSIILISIQIMATFIATGLVDKLGRRKLMLTSTVGAALGSALMGTFTFLSSLGYDLQNWNWVPVASLSFSLFMSSFGIFPLVFVILAEVLPAKIRAVGLSWCAALISVFLFIYVSVFPALVVTIGLHGVFFIFMCVCLLGVVFTIFLLPETMGKDINK